VQANLPRSVVVTRGQNLGRPHRSLGRQALSRRRTATIPWTCRGVLQISPLTKGYSSYAEATLHIGTMLGTAGRFLPDILERGIWVEDMAAVGRAGRQLVRYCGSCQAMATLGSAGRQLAGQGGSWQDRAAVAEKGGSCQDRAVVLRILQNLSGWGGSCQDRVEDGAPP